MHSIWKIKVLSGRKIIMLVIQVYVLAKALLMFVCCTRTSVGPPYCENANAGIIR